MKQIGTFSIVARDPDTQELGIAVQSKFLAVGVAVPWAQAGVGAIATQALANMDYGEIGLTLLKKGYTAQQTLDALLAMDEGRESRQVGIVDCQGNAVSFTGNQCFQWAGGITGESVACQGNILVSEATVTALLETFRETKGTLARRLVTALDKAQEAGGDKRGRQSAALLVVKEKGSYGGYNDRYIDLRVDDDPEPIAKLAHLLDLHELYFHKTLPEESVEVTEKVAVNLQKALMEKGYYQGPVNGQFDQLTRQAFEEYCGVENFEERICQGAVVDQRVLDKLTNA